MGEKKKKMIYQTPPAIKYITTALYIITSVCMAILPSYTCVYDAGGYKLGISGALSELRTDTGYVIWLLMFACMIIGIAFSINDMIKVVPLITSCYLTFSTIYSTSVLKTVVDGLDLNYSIGNSFYIVIAANALLIAMSTLMLIKTKKVEKTKEDE